MVTETALQDQIKRLKCLPRHSEQPWGTKTEPGLAHELLRVLWRVSMSDEHAKRIVDELIEASKFCPTPADILAVGNSIAEKVSEQLPSPDHACVKCGGTGMFVKKVRAVPAAPLEYYEFTCPCRRVGAAV